jgi:hypothetical protein
MSDATGGWSSQLTQIVGLQNTILIMKAKLEKVGTIITALVCLFASPGCQAPREPPFSSPTARVPLRADVPLKYRSFIDALNPAKVYFDGGNIVVAQLIVGGTEYGMYFKPLTSSLDTLDGEGGFTFVPATSLSAYLPPWDEVDFTLMPGAGSPEIIDIGGGELAAAYHYRRSQPCKCQSSLLTPLGRLGKGGPCRASCALNILGPCIT